MNTGHQVIGRPSLGSWLTYGLGSENADLPAFVVLLSGENNPDGGKSCWGSGFLPTGHQGVEFRSGGDPVLFVSNPPGVSPDVRRRSLDAIRDLNTLRQDAIGDPEIAHAHRRLRDGVPHADQRPRADGHRRASPTASTSCTAREPGQASFANNCLLARRLVERGVRFVQLYHRGWDTHGACFGEDIVEKLPHLCRQTDRPIAALLTDLKQRGLLDDTLVIWGGEFGRTPMNEARNGSKFLGRDHHPRAFTMWLAGGGIKGGITIGQTDELGYNVVEDPVHVHDLHATMLHLLGFDHTKLTYRFQGRDFRLTDVHGQSCETSGVTQSALRAREHSICVVSSHRISQDSRRVLERLGELNVTLPFDRTIETGPDAPLAQPLERNGITVGNRFCILPMEGWDGTLDGRPTDLTQRRWANFGGAEQN